MEEEEFPSYEDDPKDVHEDDGWIPGIAVPRQRISSIVRILHHLLTNRIKG